VLKNLNYFFLDTIPRYFIYNVKCFSQRDRNKNSAFVNQENITSFIINLCYNCITAKHSTRALCNTIVI
jgi:hypothetical protein